MKRLSTILLTFAVAVCCLASGLLLVACGSNNNTKLLNAYVKNGTLDTQIIIGEELDTSGVIIILELSNNLIYEVETDDLVIDDNEVDTNTADVYDLKISYQKSITKNLKFKGTITVAITVAHEADAVTVMAMSSDLLTEHRAYKKEQSAQNKNIEFYDREEPLYVGDDNEFNFRISAKGIDNNGDIIDFLPKFRTTVTVEYDGEVLTGDELERYVTVDTETATLDFTQEAVGKTFHVTVQAKNRAEGYGDLNFDTDLVVVDGFNVYNARELSVYDNTNAAWNEIKASNNTEKVDLTNVKPNAIILQDDIYVTSKDVPTSFFYKESNVDNKKAIDYVKTNYNVDITDTPVDDSSMGIYKRKLSQGEKFEFIGNYFSVHLNGDKSSDNSNNWIDSFPLMKLENNYSDGEMGNGKLHVVQTGQSANDYMTAHLCLFYTTIDAGTLNNDASVNWKNIGFVGNGARNEYSENSGALLMMKNERVNFKAYNTINQNFYIGYFFELGEIENDKNGEYEIRKCKGYDSYQCLLYSWGAAHTKIIDSEFIASGGPAIIADSYDSETKTSDMIYGHCSHIDVIGSTIKSEVTGKEPWFTVYGATELAMGLDAMAAFFNNSQQGLPKSNKSLFKPNETVSNVKNMVAVLKKNKQEAAAADLEGGYIRFYKNEQEYEQNKKNYGLGYASDFVAGVDNQNLPSLAKTLGATAAVIQNSANGAFISPTIQNTQTPNDASFIVGQTKAGTMAAAINQASVGINFTENFQAMNLTACVELLLTRIDAAEQNLDNDKLNTIISVANQYFAGNNLGGFVIEGWEQMDNAAQKLVALKNAIQQFESDYTYSSGDYINIYFGMGLGLVLGLY